jgi:hypothetical protein
MEPIRAMLCDNPQGGFLEASALGIIAKAAAPVLALCRKLVAAGFDRTRRSKHIAIAMCVLKVRSIGEAARLRELERQWLRDRPARGAGSTLWRAYSLACEFDREV